MFGPKMFLQVLVLAFFAQCYVQSGKVLSSMPLSSAALGLDGVKAEVNVTDTSSGNSTQKLDSEYEKYFSQKQNQFGGGGTFKQRYFVNKQWKSGSKNVHFLYIEGENTASVARVTDTKLPHITLAQDKDVGATVWSLEHRFRGKSQPYNRPSTSNYATSLSAANAIEDIAAFIKAQNQNLDANPKWILFGDNYGASLALWFNLKYPQLTYGVVADSAPIVPVQDFFSYEKFVEEVFSNYSYECWHGVKFSAIAVRNEIQYQLGVDRLNDELKLKPRINDYTVDYKSMQHFHKHVIELFENAVMYNRVNIGPHAVCCGVQELCAIIANRTYVHYIDRVYNLAKMIYTHTHGGKDNWPGIDNNYDKRVSYLQDTSLSDDDQASARSWLYQKCFEFGQFVTTDFGRGLFAATIPLDYYVGLCNDAFYPSSAKRYEVQALTNGIKKTKATFDTSQAYKGKNATIFVGGTDPYRLLGVTSVTDKTSTVYTLTGVGNSAVLRAAHPNDTYSTGQARKSILTRRIKSLLKTKRGKALQADQTEGIETSKHENLFTQPKQEEDHVAEQPKIKNWLGVLTTMPTEDISSTPKDRKPAYDVHNHHLLRGAVTFASQMKKFIKSMPPTAKTQEESKSRKKRALDTEYIQQDVDHFDTSNNLTFFQRYMKNANFQRFRDCLRFLMLGGEVMIDWSYVDDDLFQYYRWAKDFRAIVYALEHRFFGYSLPFQNSSTSLLKYLTTEQVLADASVFINTINVLENNTNPRWILFGGSYAGNLVAAHRVAYPQLSLGAIVSSAPLQAKTDFYEYFQRVEQDVNTLGPYGCGSQLKTYFAWNRRMLNTNEGRLLVKEAFCLPNHWDANYIDEKDAQLFIAELVYGVDEVIELDDQKHDIIRRLCLDIKQFNAEWGARRQRRDRKGARHLHRLLAKNATAKFPMFDPKMFAVGVKPDDRDDYYEGDSNYYDYDDENQIPSRYSDSESGEPEVICPYWCYGRCRPVVSYNRLITSLQNVYRDYYYEIYNERFAYTDEARLWLWLSCTSWGFAHSTNFGYNIYESGLPINFVLDLCADVFGADFNRTRMDIGVRNTNVKYGGQENYNGTKVFFINNSEDPYTPLTVNQPAHPNFLRNTTSFLIEGTGHVRDMFREFALDKPELKKARKLAKRQINRWVVKDRQAKQGQ